MWAGILERKDKVGVQTPFSFRAAPKMPSNSRKKIFWRGLERQGKNLIRQWVERREKETIGKTLPHWELMRVKNGEKEPQGKRRKPCFDRKKCKVVPRCFFSKWGVAAEPSHAAMDHEEWGGGDVYVSCGTKLEGGGSYCWWV